MNFLEDISKDREESFLNSTKSFESNKKRFDKTRKEYEFKAEDKAYVKNGSKLNRNKMDKIRLGPYPIIKQISSSFYEVGCGKKRRYLILFTAASCPFIPRGKSAVQTKVLHQRLFGRVR